MLELADRRDLGSRAARREGSSPSFPIIQKDEEDPTLRIDKEYLADHQVRLQVEMEPALLEDAKRRAARRISNRMKISGFRPGKAPYPVILRQVGEDSITEEAIELLIDSQYPSILEQAEIKPYAPGKLEKIININPPTLQIIVPLRPEVELGNYHELRKIYQPPSIEEKDVDALIKRMQRRHVVIEPVDRPAQENDLLTIKIKAEIMNPQKEENSVFIEETSRQFTIEPENVTEADAEDYAYSDWPYKGFSRELINLSANDEKTIQHTYPEDYPDEELRGRVVEFKIQVEDLKSQTLPELNNDFALSIGDYQDLDALRADIRMSLERQAIDAYNGAFDEQLLDDAIEKAAFRYPQQALDTEIDNVLTNLKNRLEQQDLSLDLYMKTRNLDAEGLRQEALPVAEKRLKRSLFLLELAEAEGIQVDSEEVQSETIQTLDYLSQTLSKKELQRISDQDVLNNLMGNVMVSMLERRAMERLREIARGEDATISTEPLEQPENNDVSSFQEEQQIGEAIPNPSPLDEDTRTI